MRAIFNKAPQVLSQESSPPPVRVTTERTCGALLKVALTGGGELTERTCGTLLKVALTGGGELSCERACGDLLKVALTAGGELACERTCGALLKVALTTNLKTLNLFLHIKCFFLPLRGTCQTI